MALRNLVSLPAHFRVAGGDRMADDKGTGKREELGLRTEAKCMAVRHMLLPRAGHAAQKAARPEQMFLRLHSFFHSTYNYRAPTEYQ